MARPRKDAPRPDTQLVALRLGRALLAQVDAHARRTASTRSGALRDLVARGLRAAESRKAASADLECAWCRAPRGETHLEGCPHRPDSALRGLLRGGRRRR